MAVPSCYDEKRLARAINTNVVVGVSLPTLRIEAAIGDVTRLRGGRQ